MALTLVKSDIYRVAGFYLSLIFGLVLQNRIVMLYVGTLRGDSTRRITISSGIANNRCK